MQKAASTKPKSVSDLSFVADTKSGRCFWRVKSAGNDWDDEKMAQRFALEYLALEEADKRGAGHLQLIVGDMPRKLGPIEIMFLTLVSYAAGAGADEARRVAAYWDGCRQPTEQGAHRTKKLTLEGAVRS